MMNPAIPDYETIERTYKSVESLVSSLPEGTETRRALHHLEIAEKYTYEAREKIRPNDPVMED